MNIRFVCLATITYKAAILAPQPHYVRVASQQSNISSTPPAEHVSNAATISQTAPPVRAQYTASVVKTIALLLHTSTATLIRKCANFVPISCSTASIANLLASAVFASLAFFSLTAKDAQESLAA